MATAAGVDGHEGTGRSGWLRVVQRVGRIVVVGLSLLVAGVLALVLVLPRTHLPVASAGSMAMPALLPLTVVAAVVAIVAWELRRRRRTAWRTVAAVLATLSLAGGLATTTQQAWMAHREGVRVDWSSALTGADVGNQAPDVDVPAYTRAQGHDVGLSIWKPTGVTGLAPVIVHVHGGGWQAGSRLDDKAHARWFADHGYLVVSIDYSLSTAEHHNWDLQESQVACALAWVDQNAARYGGDVSRLGLTGSSAGGNLVSNVASKLASGKLRSSCGGTVPTVRAVASLYGAADPVSVWDHSDPLVRSALRGQVAKYTGGSPNQYPERYAATASPNAVTAKTPPTLWVYGDCDAFVPPSSMDAMVEVLQARGVDAHGIRIPQANHVLDARNSIQQQIWRQTALDWFRGHGVA